ncbi:autoinducer 2 ABC transporter substrate-binding protein [Arthrobacter sp. EH-1B-1]|uniref:Autoinducer 2 ABC transporter substrate-binding protein n=1 Tax=Arthrobacter vasquezii TaxID=2977629 RepID=A0ABT6CTN9_9MICC|nr:autoinducer 2 ABC transporter substrate-binding protein [Arthrobacter vasquezii]MDF9277432.1 autoinducer 2 ABC transporter substrate-binding protein [Arthrobacter vasquezii]
MSSSSARALCSIALISALALTGCATNGGSGGSTSGADGGLTVAVVPKIQGVPFADAIKRGADDAAEEFGFTSNFVGPTAADPSAQADVVRSLMQQGANAIVVAPNDPDSMGPVLKEAQDRGIAVGTVDTDAPDSVRSVFVNQASSAAIGQALADQVLTPMGGSGEFAIVSCGQTASNLNSWIEELKKYTAEKYPDAKIVDTVYADEDEANAVSMAKDLINAHPNLTGLVGMCTPTAPGVARAVEETGNIGKIFTTGVGTPNSMAPYLEDGSSSASVLWDVENLGYLAGWAGYTLASGDEIAAENEVGRIGKVTYDSSTGELLLGDPLILTTANVGDYDY